MRGETPPVTRSFALYGLADLRGRQRPLRDRELRRDDEVDVDRLREPERVRDGQLEADTCPAAAGLPMIAPVAASNVRPAGSVPWSATTCSPAGRRSRSARTGKAIRPPPRSGGLLIFKRLDDR